MQREGIKTFYAKDVKAWRQWLRLNHAREKSVWLIIYRKESNVSSVYYKEAVEEALCFGWIDSKPNKRDHESFFQFFARRNPKSNWSGINKRTVEKLIRQKRMAKAGLDMIEIAKQNGKWNALDEIEALTIPADLEKALRAQPEAFKNFNAFPKSVKRGILEWILNAKQPATREKRINETAALAAQNLRANQYRPKQ